MVPHFENAFPKNGTNLVGQKNGLTFVSPIRTHLSKVAAAVLFCGIFLVQLGKADRSLFVHQFASAIFA
jgi:hypothetical protein